MNFTDLFGQSESEPAPKPATPAARKKQRAKTTQEYEDLVAIVSDLGSAFGKAQEFLMDNVKPKKSDKSVMETRATLFALTKILEGEMKAAKNAVQDLLLPMMEDKKVMRLPVHSLGKVVEYQTFNDKKTPSKHDLAEAFGAKGVKFWEDLPVRPKKRLGAKNLDKVK